MIKQRWVAGISAIFLLISLWFIGDRLLFLRTAIRTEGEVISVNGANSRCGGGRRRSSYSCTKFYSNITFSSVSGSSYTFEVSSGSSRGHNQPVSLARLIPGDIVPVLYDSQKPAIAYEDTVWAIWGTPIFTLVMQLMTFIVSLTEPRNRN